MLIKIEQFLNRWMNWAKNFLSDLSIDPARLRLMAVAIAITILSYQGVSIFYKMISFMALNKKSVSSNAVSYQHPLAATARQPLPNYAVITERNLFKTTLKETVGPGGGFFASGDEIAEFDLKGTIAGTDSFGYIIIEEKSSKKQRLYKLGSMIGSAKVLSISRNTATIRRGGKDVTLKIKHAPEGPLLSSPRPSPTPARASFNRARMAARKKEDTGSLQDMQAIMTQAQVRPYFEDGAQQGFIISSIKPDSIYQKLGLQNGDIIIEVNNKSMQSADDVMELVNLMQLGQDISMNLKRGGKLESINYSFK